jgi:DNA-binding transcriptional regulator YhcF (GntR family)
MAETETLYSARQLADELGLTLQMLSKYAQAYTKLTKRQIKKQGRDGRHFTAEQREVIKNARDAVRSQTGVTVEEAMKRALMFDAVPLEVNSWADSPALDIDRLKQALNEAVTLPLVAEIQALREEVAELRVRELSQPAAEIKNPAEVEWSPPAEDKNGLLVRLAIRVEKMLRK